MEDFKKQLIKDLKKADEWENKTEWHRPDQSLFLLQSVERLRVLSLLAQPNFYYIFTNKNNGTNTV